MATEKAFSYDKERLNKIKEMIAKGDSPYAYITNGGASPDLTELKEFRKAHPRPDLSQAQIMALECKWQSGESDPPTVFIPDMNLFPEGPDPDINRLNCSFCGVVVPACLATHGKNPRRFRISELKELNGHKWIESKIIHKADKVVSCPECVLNIAPTVHRNGGLTNNIVFPETDG